MQPRLTSVLYSGILAKPKEDPCIFVLFENLFYMIIEVVDGTVESFTLSEITEPLDEEEEVLDVSCYEGRCYLLTTSRCRVY